MSRPKEFDREVVLERAMEYFWERGYEAASMRDLLGTMQIGRQSLYDTFGDKHQLFVASLEHYYNMGIRHVVSELRSSKGGLAAIRNYFDKMGREMTTPPYRSCLVINSAIELAPHDPEVALIVNRFVNELQRGFAVALEVANRDGDTRLDDVESTAWHLTTNAMGLGPMSRARIPYSAFQAVSDQILKAIQA